LKGSDDVGMDREFIIANEQGLHARPATQLVNLANQYNCNITLTFNGVTVDMKSIMGVLSLGVQRGSTVLIRTDGDDQLEALNAISKQLTNYNLR
jgi:phosphocarrier protein